MYAKAIILLYLINKCVTVVCVCVFVFVRCYSYYIYYFCILL